MNQTIVFELSQEEDAGFFAECLTEEIFTQGDNWEELKTNVKEAVKGYYFDQPTVPNIKLHLVKVGTLNSMLRAISLHKQVSKQDILDTL